MDTRTPEVQESATGCTLWNAATGVTSTTMPSALRPVPADVPAALSNVNWTHLAFGAATPSSDGPARLAAVVSRKPAYS